MLQWTATIHLERTSLSNFAKAKAEFFSQLSASADRPYGCTSDSGSIILTFVMESASQFDAHSQASELVNRMKELLELSGIGLRDFSVNEYPGKRRSPSTFRVSFTDGAWVDVVADRYCLAGGSHELWGFYGDSAEVRATFPRNLVAAIVATDALGDSSRQPTSEDEAEGLKSST